MGAQTIYTFNAQSGSAGGILDLAPHETNTFINAMNTGDLHFGYGVFLGTTKPNNCTLPGISDGYGVTLDTPADTSGFLGVTVNNRSTELAHFQNAGQIVMHHGAGCGVMRWGRIYVHVVPKDLLLEKEITLSNGTTTKVKRIDNGDKLYLVVDGWYSKDNGNTKQKVYIGQFTNNPDPTGEISEKIVTGFDSSNNPIEKETGVKYEIGTVLEIKGKFVSPVDPKANVAMIEIFNQSNAV